jgi:hypothetical protein
MNNSGFRLCLSKITSWPNKILINLNDYFFVWPLWYPNAFKPFIYSLAEKRSWPDLWLGFFSESEAKIGSGADLAVQKTLMTKL